MTTTYESIDASSTPGVTYSRIQKRDQDYENSDVLRPWV